MTRTRRWWAAILSAIFYGLCALAPTIALASAEPASPVHCLSEAGHHGTAAPTEDSMTPADMHQGNVGQNSHARDDTGHPKAVPQCCGIACLTALPASLIEFGIEPIIHTIALSDREDSIAGTAPDALYRPPISPSSL